MEEHKKSMETQLFTLRVWLEEVDNDHVEIRGVLTHVLSGETYHFRDWQRLMQLIESRFATTQTISIGGIS